MTSTPRDTIHLPAQAAERVEQLIQQRVSTTFKTLIEHKHLYQSLEVSIDGLVPSVENVATPLARAHGRRGNLKEELEMHASAFFFGRWVLPGTLNAEPALPLRKCLVQLSDIKTFCKVCGRIEPFNLVAAVDFLAATANSGGTQAALADHVQNFVISFLCQGCKRVPEVFMVRREGAKITNCGRSPIEQVEVAKYIPKAAMQYVRGAIVAHQSRQTLAGLFLLRTSIEQWIRSLGANHDKADQAIDWYMSTLPLDFSAHFPSLRDLYSKLSDAMHKADASAALFDQTKADIERHFDARRLFKLEDPKFEH